MNYIQTVKDLLIEKEALRDNDQNLYIQVLAKYSFDVRSRSSLDLITKVKDKSLPSLDSITRLRRRVQQQNPLLRGKEYEKRHGVKQDKALSDLGYIAD